MLLLKVSCLAIGRRLPVHAGDTYMTVVTHARVPHGICWLSSDVGPRANGTTKPTRGLKFKTILHLVVLRLSTVQTQCYIASTGD